MPDTGALEAIFADLDEPGSPGGTVAVSKDGDVVATASFGRASIEHAVANRRDTVFYIASTSKQFVACSIVMLEAEGKLSLDDDIREYIPELSYDEPIRVFHLVHHTSGIRDKYALGAIGGLPEESYSTDEGTMRLLSRQRTLNFPPGSQFMYSNSGYFLLAQIVERVSGTPLRAFTEQRIFGPLGMKSTLFRDDPGTIVANKASGYRRSAEGDWRLAEYTWPSLGAGGVFSTVDDLARWDRALYGGFLEPADLPQRMVRTRPLTSGEPNPYGFGLVDDTYRGLRCVHHAGGVSGYNADFVRFPDEKLTVICLTNTSASGASMRARRVADLYLGDALEPVTAPAGIRDDVVPDTGLVSGLFLSDDEASVIEVIVAEGGVAARVGGQRVPLQVVTPATLVGPVGSEISFDAEGLSILVPGASKARRYNRIDVDEAGPPADVAGLYVSDELGTQLEISLNGRDVEIARDGGPRKTLRPVGGDRFVWDVEALSSSFEVPVFVVRGAGGHPSALRVNFDRALGTLFTRLAR